MSVYPVPDDGVGAESRFDSGDIHDGTGLSDGGLPGSIDAHEVGIWLLCCH